MGTTYKFVAREDQLVREAGVVQRIGSPPRYYGRVFDAGNRAYPAAGEPFSVDSDSEDGIKCAKFCRKGSLFAADAETAAAVGVKFVNIEFADGAWTAKASRPARDEKPAKAAS